MNNPSAIAMAFVFLSTVHMNAPEDQLLQPLSPLANDHSPLAVRVDFDAEAVQSLLGIQSESEDAVACDVCYASVRPSAIIDHSCGNQESSKKRICKTCILGMFQSCCTACSRRGFWKHVPLPDEMLPCPFCKTNIISDVSGAQREIDAAMESNADLALHRRVMQECRQIMLDAFSVDREFIRDLAQAYDQETSVLVRLYMQVEQLKYDREVALTLNRVRERYIRAAVAIATFETMVTCYRNTVPDCTIFIPKANVGVATEDIRRGVMYMDEEPFETLDCAKMFLRVGIPAREEQLRYRFEAALERAVASSRSAALQSILLRRADRVRRSGTASDSNSRGDRTSQRKRPRPRE